MMLSLHYINIFMFNSAFTKILLILFAFILLANCSGLSKVDARKTPTNAMERARKNVEEGRGVSIDGILSKRKGTNYEFSTSNPMWRASLEVLDFIPMATVDYSGGMIISDWYSDNSSSNNESIKISIRFLSNEVRSDSLKIIVHKKVCKNSTSCNINVLSNSKISQELTTTIIRKAALLEKQQKNKKK